MSEYVGKMHRIISGANFATVGNCMYFDRNGRQCRERAIQSHSVQRNGPLRSISESGHVIRIAPELRAQKLEDRTFFNRVGLAKASTFPGFCEIHDSDVFSDVETAEVSLEARSALIFSIRAAALEHFEKRRLVEVQREILKQVHELIGTPKGEVALLVLKGASQEVEAGTARMKQLFACYHKGVPANYLYLGVKFESESIFAATGGFEPDWSLDFKSLYSVHPRKTKWNFLTVFCGNIGGKFIVFLGGFQRYRNHRIDRFLNSIDVGSKDFISTIFSISTIHTDNSYVRESWYHSLLPSERRNIEKMMASGVMEGIRDPSPMKLRVFLPSNVVSTYTLHS